MVWSHTLYKVNNFYPKKSCVVLTVCRHDVYSYSLPINYPRFCALWPAFIKTALHIFFGNDTCCICITRKWLGIPIAGRLHKTHGDAICWTEVVKTVHLHSDHKKHLQVTVCSGPLPVWLSILQPIFLWNTYLSFCLEGSSWRQEVVALLGVKAVSRLAWVLWGRR